MVERIAVEHPQVRCLPSPYQNGFGFAVRAGLEAFEGDAVAIVMADGSDSPEDLVSYQRLLEEGYECAFGSRFVHGATVIDYPRSKLIMNRIVNWGIRVLFRHGYNDTTNAFKAYRREVIENVQPFLSHHFNLTVELPLKAVVRGYSYGDRPDLLDQPQSRRLEAPLNEMGSRYLFIVLYVFLEHHLSRGDYRRDGSADGPSPRHLACGPGTHGSDSVDRPGRQLIQHLGDPRLDALLGHPAQAEPPATLLPVVDQLLGDRHPLLQLLPEPRHPADHLLVAGDDVVESDPTARTDQAAIQLEVATDPLVAMVAVDQGEVHRSIAEPLGHLVTRPRVGESPRTALNRWPGSGIAFSTGSRRIDNRSRRARRQIDRKQLGIGSRHPAEQEECPSLRRADLEHRAGRVGLE